MRCWFSTVNSSSGLISLRGVRYGGWMHMSLHQWGSGVKHTVQGQSQQESGVEHGHTGTRSLAVQSDIWQNDHNLAMLQLPVPCCNSAIAPAILLLPLKRWDVHREFQISCYSSGTQQENQSVELQKVVRVLIKRARCSPAYAYPLLHLLGDPRGLAWWCTTSCKAG